MADDANTQQPEVHAEAQSRDAHDFEPITSQEQLERVLGKRLERERSKFADYDNLREKAGKYDQLEQEKKSEIERVTEDRDGYKSRATEAELARDRLEIALEKGLTKTQAKRLVGSTREELEADADELLADIGAQKPRTPRPNAAQSGGDNPPQGDWLRRQIARR